MSALASHLQLDPSAVQAVNRFLFGVLVPESYSEQKKQEEGTGWPQRIPKGNTLGVSERTPCPSVPQRTSEHHLTVKQVQTALLLKRQRMNKIQKAGIFEVNFPCFNLGLKWKEKEFILAFFFFWSVRTKYND